MAESISGLPRSRVVWNFLQSINQEGTLWENGNVLFSDFHDVRMEIGIYKNSSNGVI